MVAPKGLEKYSADQIDANPWLAKVEALQLARMSDPRKPNTSQTPDEWVPKFLESYATCGNMTTAATAAGVAVMTVYKLRERDPDFLTAIEMLRACFVDILEEEAFRRAVVGTHEKETTTVSGAVVINGKKVDTDDMQQITQTVKDKGRRYSDRLLMEMLRAYAPDKYRPALALHHMPADDLIATVAREQGLSEEVVRRHVERIGKLMRDKRRDLMNADNARNRAIEAQYQQGER
jgi:hypothetical protein